MKMKNMVSVVLVGLIIVMNFSLLSADFSEGSFKTKFSNDKASDILTFEAGGGEAFLYIQLPKGSTVRSAHLNITGLEDASGSYPLNPRLDLGNDDNTEWGYNQSGYGAMGHQTRLDNDATTRTVSFSVGGSNSDAKIILPKNAEVSSATVNLEGRLNDFGIKTVIENQEDRIGDMDIADIDNDGDFDIAIAKYVDDGKVVWYNNSNGLGTSWSQHTIISSISYPSDLILEDLNGDGTVDIAVSSYWRNYLVWSNNTDGIGRSWSSRNMINNTSQRISDLEAGDLDNDGDMDLAATFGSTTGARVVWYNNTAGDASSWTRHNIDATEQYAEDIIIVDLDRDGDNDTVITNNNGADVKWYDNLGNASSWSAEHIINNNGLSNGASLIAVDINEDNNTDIVGLGNSLRWFEAPPDPTGTWSAHTIASPGMNWYFGEVASADLGFYNDPPDGHMDLAMVTAESDDVVWYKNNPNNPGSSFTAHTIRTNHNYARFLRAVDLGGKAYPDLIVGAYTQTSDDLVWYEVNMSYPLNVRLDVGGDGDNEYIATPGFLTSEVTTGDFTIELNQHLQSGTPGADGYGNKIVSLPLQLKTDMPGKIIIKNIEIEYEYTATAELFPGGDFASKIETLIGPVGIGGGFTYVYLKFTSESAGKLEISDLFIEYNDYPKLKSPIPSDASIQEDKSDHKLIDISQYFGDDYLEPDQLTYEIINYTNDDKLNIYITDSVFLGIDSDNGTLNDNWFGSTEVFVRAIDDDDLVVESNEFTINITPVNDEPLYGADELPIITLVESQESDPLFLAGSKIYFYDLENNDLYFDAEIDPENVIFDEELELKLDEELWALTIVGLNDWYGENIPLRIYCDDDPDVDKTQNHSRDTKIIVYNQDDDAPTWKPLPTLYINEGSSSAKTNDLLHLAEYVDDIDDQLFSLSFQVVDYTNDTKLKVSVDSQANLDVNLEDKDFVGTTTVTLRASDPGGNYADTTLEIEITSVNDPPTTTLISPQEDASIWIDTVILTWEGQDVDNEQEDLTYSIYLDTFSGQTLLVGNITENSYRASGLENGFSYFWQVIPSDGQLEGTCLNGIISFDVKFSENPTTSLLTPLDDSVINKTTIDLEWDYSYSGSELFEPTYDLYFKQAEANEVIDNFKHFKVPYKVGLADEKFNLADLEDGATYYWTVIPRAPGGGEGICSSGVWSFSIDLTAKSYGFQMEIENRTVTLEQGEIKTVSIKLINNGVSKDTIVLEISSDLLTLGVTIPDFENNMVILDPLSIKYIDLKIDTTDTPVGDIDVKIKATSLGDDSTQTESMDLIIEKPKEAEKSAEGEFMAGNATMIFALIAIVIVIILLTLFFILKKRKTVETLEPEPAPGGIGYGSPKMYDAELIGGPMSIGDVTKDGGIGTGARPMAPGLGRPGTAEIKRLPPPRTRVIRRQKIPKRPPADYTDFMPPTQVKTEPSVETSGSKRAPDVLLPTFKTADKSKFEDDGGLQFKRPGDVKEPDSESVEKTTEEKKVRRGPPRIKLPGEP
jgi:hypothetical protein